LHINQIPCSDFTWASVLPQPFCASHPASRQTPSHLRSLFRFLLCVYYLLDTLRTCGLHFPASISLACVSSRVLFFSSFNSQLFVPLVLPLPSNNRQNPATLSVHRISASSSATLIPSRFFRARTCNAMSTVPKLNETSYGSARPSCQHWFESILRIAQAIVLSVLTLVRTARTFSLFLPLTTFLSPNYGFFPIVLPLPYTKHANRPDVQPNSACNSASVIST
jgi:hypothetical protein